MSRGCLALIFTVSKHSRGQRDWEQQGMAVFLEQKGKAGRGVKGAEVMDYWFSRMMVGLLWVK